MSSAEAASIEALQAPRGGFWGGGVPVPNGGGVSPQKIFKFSTSEWCIFRAF